MSDKNIIWTNTDEAPALATYSLLPIVQAYTGGTGIRVEARDISLAGRILTAFPETLTKSQRTPDNLSLLGELSLTADANIIKLPNISASIPQLKEAITELQSEGYDIPDYPETPATDDDKAIQTRYAKVLGSAVNPVLREGNSDRRAPLAVKNFARKHPHKLGAWSADSKAEVATMDGGDFYGNEQSVVVQAGGAFRIELAARDGRTVILKDGLTAAPGEILDGTFMSVKALRKFYEEQIEDARKSGQLLSLHLKATMMKVSDPILFGHAVSVFFKDVFARHAAAFKSAGVNPNLGLGDLYKKIQSPP
ncbi:MAG TPA: NADP-dependent isocitrate dehydrogenase, partial [Thermoanaerobaculia bacterium]|nr:NADP-dependent isocitrate dehydrogenase [Thermoanaerobaculia bacterium]